MSSEVSGQGKIFVVDGMAPEEGTLTGAGSLTGAGKVTGVEKATGKGRVTGVEKVTGEGRATGERRLTGEARILFLLVDGRERLLFFSLPEKRGEDCTLATGRLRLLIGLILWIDGLGGRPSNWSVDKSFDSRRLFLSKKSKMLLFASL